MNRNLEKIFKDIDKSKRLIISGEDWSDNDNSSQLKKRFLPKFIIFLILLLVVILILLNSINSNKSQDNGDTLYLFEKISKVDSTIIKLDNAISGTIDADRIKYYNTSDDEVNKAKVELNKINENIDLLENNNHSIYITYARQAVDTRLQMLEYGNAIYKTACVAINAVEATEDFWNLALQADNLLKEADDCLSNNININEATNKSLYAKSLLNSSKEKIKVINAAGIKFDLSDYELYINTKIDAAQHCIAMCNAINNLDVDGTQNESRMYFEKDNLAIQYAKTIVSVPAQLIRTRYDLDVKDDVDIYKTVRKDCAANDALIRNYLNN
ncbi:MAG: hypothetical protein Q4E88_04440 [Coriobacteriia bacterium]|nr:hypothetical protein [Coriobacteriia bacterium]